MSSLPASESLPLNISVSEQPQQCKRTVLNCKSRPALLVPTCEFCISTRQVPRIASAAKYEQPILPTRPPDRPRSDHPTFPNQSPPPKYLPRQDRRNNRCSTAPACPPLRTTRPPFGHTANSAATINSLHNPLAPTSWNVRPFSAGRQPAAHFHNKDGPYEES
jgi:hypothetical protein